ncbi:MAG: response regulator [Anaerolineales bacterium]|nr:response regulator [Anaerolineales bacterium]
MAPGERILIVENDPDIADLIGRQALKPMGYQTFVAETAGDAIRIAAQNPPDLILTSINLPGLSGKDLLAALNSQNIKSPSIVIAAKGQEADAIQAFRLGAIDVLFWPLRDAEVVAIVERALRQTQESRERQKLDRQLKTTHDELQRRLRDMTTIMGVAKAVTSVGDQRQLFDRILESAAQLSDADMCWLTLREDKSNAFMLRAQRGLPDSWAKKMNQPLDDGISSLVALSAESLFINGAPLQKFKIAALGKSAGVIPIKIKSEVIGLLIVVRKSDKEFLKDSQTMLGAMADYASIALVNARLFQALGQAAESARVGEKSRSSSLDTIRKSIRAEVEAGVYPLNLVLTEMPGALNVEQKKALEAVKESLIRLTRVSENTAPRR